MTHLLQLTELLTLSFNIISTRHNTLQVNVLVTANQLQLDWHILHTNRHLDETCRKECGKHVLSRLDEDKDGIIKQKRTKCGL